MRRRMELRRTEVKVKQDRKEENVRVDGVGGDVEDPPLTVRGERE